MNETNRKGMQDLGRGAERNRNMFRELKNLMNKGKGKEELAEFLTEEGEAIKNEDEIVAEIEKVWGKLLNTSGEAVLGVEKERFEMIDGDREIMRGELEKAWSKIKRGKAMDESEIEDINKEKLERQIVTVPKQRHFNPINLNLNLNQVPEKS
ncbi:hypothetical protein CAPTEDRAFT_205878 [Capitella teleta]|uniref:Uncharacterized protein n=1 Tax=Capitella teleta TaxID=283909 RepID=R7U345_CAPTE|nr:hypothetical protein CAPTEDRAFT_205878 [Capitella teleta]|eukprot:ELT97600.1 hypothetical protein CAPTEDRAFT_205878 [Capitella teleta]